MRPRRSLSLRRFHQIAILTVAGVCLLTVAGAIVRLTGSGLGCDDWPNCNSERFIDVSTGHAAIEQVNRLLSGVIGIPTLLLAIGAFRVWPRRRGLVGPSLGVLLTILGNGVVGGLAVRGDLHPSLVQSHFLLAMLSIGFGLVAVHRSDPEPVGPRADIGVTPLVTGWFVALGALVAAALVTGTVVTGAGPHAGDETARRYGFDISTVAELHSVTVWIAVAIFLVVVVAAATHARCSRPASAGSSRRGCSSPCCRAASATSSTSTMFPAVLVAVHVAGATALWVATVWLLLGRPRTGRRGSTEVHVPETDHTVSGVVAGGEYPLSSARLCAQRSRRTANRTDGVWGFCCAIGLVGRRSRPRRLRGPRPGSPSRPPCSPEPDDEDGERGSRFPTPRSSSYEAVIVDRTIDPSVTRSDVALPMRPGSCRSIFPDRPVRRGVDMSTRSQPASNSCGPKAATPGIEAAGRRSVTRVLFNLAEGDAAGAARDKQSDGS